MQAHVGEERSTRKVVRSYPTASITPSLPSWNHPPKSPCRMMLSLFEHPILGLERNVVIQLKWRIQMEKILDVQEQRTQEKTKMYHFAPVLVLIVLAPMIAE